jgi:predicted HAD superfamily Cof-like phosphohydrolase
MDSKTNFNKVQEFNSTFGVETYDTPKLSVFDENSKLINLRLGLVTEECQELVDAVKDKDFIETCDALADILYVCYGFFDAIGVDADKAFDIVQRSNMSKVCPTEEQAHKTVQWYLENMLDTYDSPAYKKSPCGKYWVVYNKSTGKVLKNVDYLKVDFTKLLHTEVSM